MNVPCNDKKNNNTFRFSFAFYFRSEWKLTRAAARNDVTAFAFLFFSFLIAAQRIRMWNYFELVIFYGLWMQLPLPHPRPPPTRATYCTPALHVPFVSVCWCLWLALIELLIVIVIVIVATAAAAHVVVVVNWNMLLLLLPVLSKC